MGDAVEPVADLLGPPDRRGLANEDEEGGLEGVLGVVMTAEYSSADAPHHRAVPPRQGLDSALVPLLDEAPEQLPIRHPRHILPEQGGAEMADDIVPLRRHRPSSP